GCTRVRRDQPEQRVRTRQRAVEHCGIRVRALDDLDPVADALVEVRGVADDHANGAALFEQPVDELAADPAGGCGDDDHVSLHKLNLNSGSEYTTAVTAGQLQ